MSAVVEKNTLGAGDHCPRCPSGVMQANPQGGITCTNCHHEVQRQPELTEEKHRCPNCGITTMPVEGGWQCTNCGQSSVSAHVWS